MDWRITLHPPIPLAITYKGNSLHNMLVLELIIKSFTSLVTNLAEFQCIRDYGPQQVFEDKSTYK